MTYHKKKTYEYNVQYIIVAEREQFVADIERLTSDKEDLLTRLKCCEEELKTANECENFSLVLIHNLVDELISVYDERENSVWYDGCGRRH